MRRHHRQILLSDVGLGSRNGRAALTAARDMDIRFLWKASFANGSATHARDINVMHFKLTFAVKFLLTGHVPQLPSREFHPRP